MKKEYTDALCKQSFKEIKVAMQYMKEGSSKLFQYKILLKLFLKLQMFVEKLNYCKKSDVQMSVIILHK